MTQQIAIIGAGQLGSRHLQALALLDRPARVQVVDLDPDRLATARERFAEVAQPERIDQVEYLDSIDALSRQIDLAIVATPSTVRSAVVEALLDRAVVDALVLEKFLFPKADEYQQISNRLAQSGTQAWVNCPRRLWPVYTRLRDVFHGQVVDYRVTGSAWGLGCNAIHFLDHLAFLTGEAQLSVDARGLDERIAESRRQGFIEFTGTLSGNSNRGSRFHLTSNAQGDDPIEITVESDDVRCQINEQAAQGWIEQRTGDWHREPLRFTIPYQSQLTHQVAEQIFDTGTCGLTRFDDSAQLHLTLLDALLEHYRRHTHREALLCPIT